MLVLAIVSFILTLALGGYLGLVVGALGAIVDAFLILGWVRAHNTALIESFPGEPETASTGSPDS